MYANWGGFAAVIGSLPDAGEVLEKDRDVSELLGKLNMLQGAHSFQHLCDMLQSPACAFSDEQVNRLNSPLLDALLCGVFGETQDPDMTYDKSQRLQIPCSRSELKESVTPSSFIERCARYNSDACAVRYCADRFWRIEEVDDYPHWQQIGALDRVNLLDVLIDCYESVVDKRAFEILIAAVGHSAVNVIKLMVQRKRGTEDDFINAIWQFSEFPHRDLATLLALLDDKYRVFGGIALTRAARCDDYDIVRSLLDVGFSVNACWRRRSNTVLSNACEGNSLRIVKLLVERGADISARKFICMKKVSLDRGSEIARYLMQRGVPVSRVGGIFAKAVTLMDLEMSKFCLEYGVQLLDHSVHLRETFHQLAIQGHRDLRGWVDLIIDTVPFAQHELNEILADCSDLYMARAVIRKGAQFERLVPLPDLVSTGLQHDVLANIEFCIEHGFSSVRCVEFMLLQAVAYGSVNVVSYLRNRFGEPVLATVVAINSAHAYAAVKLGQLDRLKVFLERGRIFRGPVYLDACRCSALRCTTSTPRCCNFCEITMGSLQTKYRLLYKARVCTNQGGTRRMGPGKIALAR